MRLYHEARMIQWIAMMPNGLPDIGQFTAEERRALQRLKRNGIIVGVREPYAGAGTLKTHYYPVVTKENLETCLRIIEEAGRLHSPGEDDQP